MEKYDGLIFVAIASIAIIGIFAALGKITDAWSTAAIGIIVGIILFLISVKLSKVSTEVSFVLFNEPLRKILEALDEEKDLAEIMSSLGMAPGSGTSRLQFNLDYLVRRKFIKERGSLITKKYSRMF